MAKIVIYTKDHCPFCERAKKLLDTKGAKYELINLENDPDELNALKNRTGLRTVPQIFINGTFVGGHDDLVALDRAGKLDPLLAAAP